MTKLNFLFLLFTFAFFSCDNKVDKSLVSQAVKLNSPFSDFVLYRYHVESSMAFGSGFTAIKILPSGEECDYSDRDFFRFGNNYPLLIKWKNKNTLTVKCLGEGSLAEKQPVKRDTLQWRNWRFEVEYYSVFSSGTNGSHAIESYQLNPNLISFKTDNDLLIFNANEVAMVLDSNEISLRRFKVDTFNSKTGLSLADYKLNMSGNYKPKDFYDLQPFIKTKP